MLKKSAFTFMELIAVLIILGIIAAFAIPNYNASLNQSYAKDALNNLMSIQAAQLSFKQNNSGYSNQGTTAALNTSLGLSIVPSGNTSYSCASNKCVATRSNGFTMTLDLLLPIKNMEAVYCSVDLPNSTWNPCCATTINNTGGTTGNPCPK